MKRLITLWKLKHGLAGLFFLLLIQSSSLFAQPWLQEYPSINDSLVSSGIGVMDHDILETPEGDFITATSHIPAGQDDYDITIIKVDSVGELLWTQTYGSSGTEAAYSSAATPDGGLVITGLLDSVLTEDGNQGPSFAMKVDGTGALLWYEEFAGANGVTLTRDIEATADNEYLITGYASLIPTAGLLNYYLIRLDSNGNILTEEIFNFTSQTHVGTNIIPSQDGNVLVGAYANGIDQDNPNDVNIMVMKMAPNLLDTLWTSSPFLTDNDFTTDLIELSNGDILVTAYLLDNNIRLIKLNSTGELLWSQIFDQGVEANLLENPDGTVQMLMNNATPGYASMSLLHLTADGELLYREDFPGLFGNGFIQTTDQSYVIMGRTGEFSDHLFLLRTGTDGRYYQSLLQGNVWHDLDQDCTVSSADSTIKSGWIVQATKGTFTWYATTDSTGSYEIPIDTGTISVNVQPLSPLWAACPGSNPQSVDLNINDTSTVNTLFDVLLECPLLTVDLATTRLRRCFDNDYFLEYCNLGTQTAFDAYVEVVLDPYLSLNSASVPYTQNDSLIIFEVGDLTVGECGTIQMDVYVDCDSTVLGQIHCSTAHIYPDSLCLPPDTNWDLSSLEVLAECIGDSVQFQIINVGTGDMSTGQDYYIVVDEVIMYQGVVQLPSGETLTLTVPANFEVFHLLTNQSPGHPGNGQASVLVTGCPDASEVGLFFNWLALDDDVFFQDIDCRPNIGSYDPNDKQAFPRGYGDPHFIEAGTEIEYLIRFQNTGTDTAFTVVIEDQLSSELDIPSFRPGVSSHDYTWNIEGNGLLKFRFDNIMLPDSNVNQAASNGFIKFNIRSRADLPIGTLIENTASIFFDFNDPIITNTAYHTIGEDFIEMVIITDAERPETDYAVDIFPNPFREQVTFELKDAQFNRLELSLYNSLGQLVIQQTASGQRLELQPQPGLAKGVYFYEFYGDGLRLSSGKLLVK